jgi:hypothetical membrane protein
MTAIFIFALVLIVLGACLIAWSVRAYRGTDDFSGAVPYLAGWALLLIGVLVAFVAAMLIWRWS